MTKRAMDVRKSGFILEKEVSENRRKRGESKVATGEADGFGME
jgi:hypothetical protein